MLKNWYLGLDPSHPVWYTAGTAVNTVYWVNLIQNFFFGRGRIFNGSFGPDKKHSNVAVYKCRHHHHQLQHVILNQIVVDQLGSNLPIPTMFCSSWKVRFPLRFAQRPLQSHHRGYASRISTTYSIATVKVEWE